MGASNSKNDSETINWNNIKTENVSSAMPNLNGLSKEAKQLIASLNIPEITETQTSEFTVNHILDTINTNLNKEDKQKFSAILDQVSSQTNSEELSNTSPFISSEMYDYLVNSKTSEDKNQAGGAKSRKSGKSGKSSKATKPAKSGKSGKSKKGGSHDLNDSDTSSTSSDSELEDILDSTEAEIIKEKSKDKKHKDKKHMKEDSDSDEMSGGELSYLSSSAHTDGDFSESNSESSVSKTSHTSVESSSDNETSVNKNSVTDENKEMLSTSVSVNTDDINMVSDY